uniref:PA domain-containing protein n=1 Tax=Anolis carolinensis TaxID=28377 RepID=A0A803T208_ANOCA
MHNGALPALFGVPIPEGGLVGSLVEARPSDACQPIDGPPNASAVFIVLIPRYGCSFAAKVLHAQQAGFQAAIVHNVNSQALVNMVREREEQPPLRIPAVFTAEVTSKMRGEVGGATNGRPGLGWVELRALRQG